MEDFPEAAEDPVEDGGVDPPYEGAGQEVRVLEVHGHWSDRAGGLLLGLQSEQMMQMMMMMMEVVQYARTPRYSLTPRVV